MEPQKLSSQIEHKIGSRIGHNFTVTGLLGSGGMGNVYRATQDHIGREVAIKFLPVDIAANETAIKRLSLEARALGQLSHPGIVTTFDFGFTEEREPYLVLELVHGESLQQILEREKRLTALRAVPLFIQIAEAMSYAHSAFIVHRDLKPHNIMIGLRDEGEFAKILDFGIVKLTSESQHLTRAGEIWGSPFYMSPEQCTGAPVDNRSDIYCLGAVMYRTITGQVPHRGASFAETVARKLNEIPPPFSVVAPDIDVLPELEAIILKCLKRNPDERYKSMLELRSDLLKLFRSKLDNEATMTYDKITAVTELQAAQSAINAAASASNLSHTGMQALSPQTPPVDPGHPLISPVLPTARPKDTDKKGAADAPSVTAPASAAAAAKSQPKSDSAQASAKSGKTAGANRDLKIIAVLVALFVFLIGGICYGAFTLYSQYTRSAATVPPAALTPAAVQSVKVETVVPQPGGKQTSTAVIVSPRSSASMPAALPATTTATPAGSSLVPAGPTHSRPVSAVSPVSEVTIYKAAEVKPHHARVINHPHEAHQYAAPVVVPQTTQTSQGALKKRLAQAARQAARQPKETIKEVRQVFKSVTDTFKSHRSLSDDPNRFYRDFGGH